MMSAIKILIITLAAGSVRYKGKSYQYGQAIHCDADTAEWLIASNMAVPEEDFDGEVFAQQVQSRAESQAIELAQRQAELEAVTADRDALQALADELSTQLNEANEKAAQRVGLSAEQRQVLIRHAVSQLSKADFNKDKTAKVDAIEAALGFDISADERDAAMVGG